MPVIHGFWEPPPSTAPMFRPQTLQSASGHGRHRNDAAQLVAALDREQPVQFGFNSNVSGGGSRPVIVMRECVLILAVAALVGCSAPRAGTCRAWSEDRQSLANQTTYFETANSTLSAEARSNVVAVAHYMEASPIVAVRIEGHGDGGGTDWYNYELGDRRAEALREELLQLRVDPARVDAIACGKKPRSDRAYVPGAPRKWCRAEFVVLLPPQ